MTHTGKLRIFYPRRGFGFIRRDGDGADIYVHATAPRQRKFWRNAVSGARIRFELGATRDGRPCAVNLQQE